MEAVICGGKFRPPVPVRRMVVALSASLIVHALVLWMPRGAGEARRETAQSLLQLRLEPQSAQAPVPPQAIAQAAAAGTAPEVPQSGGVSRALMPDGAMPPLPARMGRDRSGGSAPRFFLARELDHYPVPLTPLSVGGQGHGHIAAVRIWVSIDDRGRVIDAVAENPRSDDESFARAREILLSTPFAPARKEGRAVRSRLLVSLTYGP